MRRFIFFHLVIETTMAISFLPGLVVDIFMGQIIKLYDYISRYEQNVYHYPARFIGLKRKQWEALKHHWENGSLIEDGREQSINFLSEQETEEKSNRFRRLTQFIQKRKTGEDGNAWRDSLEQITQPIQPKSIEELKRYFLDELFHVQLKWASSTISQKSYLDSSFLREWQLKFFAQRFPDTFLFLYKPVFQFKKAPVEVETILLTPTECYCITFLENDADTVYIGSEERFWEVREYQKVRKQINPTISLNRTEKVIKSIFAVKDIDFPVSKILITKEGYIDYPSAPYGLTIIDKRNYEDWFKEMRSFRSPLKYDQLKVADALLSFCKTQAFLRSEWND